MLAMNYNLRGI
jgi:hypothetical protein